MVGFDHWSYGDTSCLDNIKDFKSTCHSHYHHAPTVSSANPAYYKWKNVYEMLKHMMLLRIYNTIYIHDLMLTSGKLQTSQVKYITRAQENDKHI